MCTMITYNLFLSLLCTRSKRWLLLILQIKSLFWETKSKNLFSISKRIPSIREQFVHIERDKEQKEEKGKWIWTQTHLNRKREEEEVTEEKKKKLKKEKMKDDREKRRRNLTHTKKEGKNTKKKKNEPFPIILHFTF